MTIPVSARLTTHRKSACWAHRRLDGPTTNLRCQSRGLRSKRTDTARRPIALVSASTAIAYSLPPTCSQVSTASVRPARWHGRELPGVFRADPAPPDPVLCVYAGHRPATQGSGDRQNTAVFDTPTRYTKRASGPRFRRSKALSSTWWQVKDSNHRSSRDGFTDQRLQACDQRQYLSPDNFRAYSPQIAGDSRLQPDTPSEQFAFTTSHNVEPDASDPGHHVEISCQPNSTSAQIDASPPATSSPSAGMTHGLSDATRILREVQHPVVVVCVEDFLDKIAQPGGLSASP